MPGMAQGPVGGGGKKRQARARKGKGKRPVGPPRPTPEIPADAGSAFSPGAAADAGSANSQFDDYQLPPQLQQMFNPKNKGPA